MIVSYCVTCLPTKVVLGYSNSVKDLRVPHNAHPQTMKNGWFPLSIKDWKAAFVEGDDPTTKANIMAQHPDKFVVKNG